MGDADDEIKAFSTKFERIKKLAEFYLSKVSLKYFLMTGAELYYAGDTAPPFL